ncbi:basic proline-rich protein-like [Eubalaena glacialis]|uniref:basic proline-rich protein-like n=1 Tax=Eubalaena glacialis TaxID=27606 RepID=UPI002A5AC93B|nr:basic proline-rich protein-like [Eubalaena glacialis]
MTSSSAGDRHSPKSSAAAQSPPAALARPAPARRPSAPLPVPCQPSGRPLPSQARLPSPSAAGRAGFGKRERTESKTSWRPTAISCTFCKCHRVKINRPPLRPAGSPRAHDSAPCPGTVGPADPPFPCAPWSPAPRHSSTSHHALLCPETRPQVTGQPGPLPFGAPPCSHKLPFYVLRLVPILAVRPWIQGSLSPTVEPRGHPQPTLGGTDPTTPSPTSAEPPESARLHPPTGPPAGHPTSPGATSLPEHTTTAATPPNFSRDPGGLRPTVTRP